MILPILKYGEPVLRAKGKRVGEITAAVRALADNMLATMRAANGVGLAAQQVGEPLQLAIVDVAGVEDRPSEMFVDGQLVDLGAWMPLIFTNPELTLDKARTVGSEGCLSFPDITADISRAARVRVRVRLLDGRDLEFEATGLLARALQHEVDHLNGVLFIDRMNSATKAGLAGRLKRLQRETLAPSPAGLNK
ncbi:MAG: peptide deformylase [Chthoniobacter sp.]|jgi:peptide deformylase|nr:peptide deformylase [Chthoniobacter sp.]